MPSTTKFYSSYTSMPLDDTTNLAIGRLDTIQALGNPRTRHKAIDHAISSVPETRKLPIWNEVKKFHKQMDNVDNRIIELEREIQKLQKG